MKNRDIFFIFFNMAVCCVFSLESPHRGNSNEYTQYTILNIKKKITLNFPKSAAVGFPKDSRTSYRHGRRAISVRVTEALLYVWGSTDFVTFFMFLHGLLCQCLAVDPFDSLHLCHHMPGSFHIWLNDTTVALYLSPWVRLSCWARVSNANLNLC